VSINGVLDYQLPIEQVVSRLAGRRTCGGCKAVFHVSSRPPKVADVCDHCEGKLFQREDDRPEAIRVRMEAYARSTAPLTEYYRKLGLLIEIQAEGGPEAILERSLKVLGVG
jgi:adenylate kinase